MIYLVLFFIYCILTSIKRVLKPRMIPRPRDKDIQVFPIMILIILVYSIYNIVYRVMTFSQLRNSCI